MTDTTAAAEDSPSPDQRVVRLLARLRHTYPDATVTLDHCAHWQLLIATILSAQQTDQQVNRVTPALFARFPSPQDLAAAPPDEIEYYLRTLGLFRVKARYIQGTCRQLVAEHAGEVPADLAALTALPGVGRKTALVVLGHGFGLAPGIVVDTHCMRLSRRLGLTDHRDPIRVERGLLAVVPAAARIAWTDLLIAHGRAVCTARRPRCSECPVADLCPRVGVTNAA